MNADWSVETVDFLEPAMSERCGSVEKCNVRYHTSLQLDRERCVRASARWRRPRHACPRQCLAHVRSLPGNFDNFTDSVFCA